MLTSQPFEAGDPHEFSTLESVRHRIDELAGGGQVRREDIDSLYDAMRSLAEANISKECIETLVDICVLADQFGGFAGHPLGIYTLDTARRFGDKRLLLSALRASPCIVARTPSGEVIVHSEALALARELRDSEAEFKITLNMMTSLAALGQFATAERIGRYAQNLRGFDVQLRAYLFSHLAALTQLTRSSERTRREIAEAICELDLGDTTHQSAVTNLNRRILRCVLYSNASSLCASLGDLHSARQHFRTFQAMAAGDSSPILVMCEGVAAAEIALAEGRIEDGLDHMSRARDLARESWGDMYYIASVSVVDAYEAAGRPEMALSVLRELIDYTQSQQEEVLRCDEMLRSLQLVGLESPAEEGYRLLLKRASGLEQEVAQRWQSLLQACANADAGAGHDLRRSFRMRKVATLFCRFLRWSEEEAAEVAISAQLANIGMVGLPSTLLMKPILSGGERHLMQSHTVFGERLIEREGLKALMLAAKVARHHHERWDGGGYPDGLVGEGIPAAARIVALCDAFDALMHQRPWRARPLSIDEAIAEISREAGLQFDPTLAEEFVAFVESDLKVVEDLDAFLGRDGDESAYVRAREHIAAMVSHPIDLAGA
jgi:HD-GYP domain-containing protein (c-di-GMP phosphodiesterase class II)